MKSSTEETKSKKSNKSFFSKLWKTGSSQSKDEKKKISKSADSLNNIIKDDNFEKEIKALSENPNSAKKSKSLDILSSNTKVEEIKSKSLDILNNNIEITDLNLLDKRVQSPYEIEIRNSSEEKINDNGSTPDNGSFHTSVEYTDELKKGDTIKSDYKDILDFSFSDKLDENQETNNLNVDKRASTKRSSSLTLLINNKDMVFEKDGLTAYEFAKKLYDSENSEYEGKQIALIITET